VADLSQLAKSGKALRDRSLDVSPYQQVGIYIDAEIARGLRGLDRSAVN